MLYRPSINRCTKKLKLIPGLWRNPAAVVRAGGHDGGVLAALESGDGAAGAIPGVEHVCGMPELHHLADELSRAVLRSQT